MDAFATILLVLVILFGIGTVLSGLFTVATAKAAIVQRFGKFVRVAGPGLNFKLPWVEQVVAKFDQIRNAVILGDAVNSAPPAASSLGQPGRPA
jgi:regulator of protease activity HflC (stomatin/prohibitin superfamily)